MENPNSKRESFVNGLDQLPRGVLQLRGDFVYNLLAQPGRGLSLESQVDQDQRRQQSPVELWLGPDDRLEGDVYRPDEVRGGLSDLEGPLEVGYRSGIPCRLCCLFHLGEEGYGRDEDWVFIVLRAGQEEG